MNHRAIITQHGGPDVFQIIEEPLPEPSAGEVRLKVLASGVAFGDVLKREGLLPGMPRLPYTPGYDLVGQVETLGPGVTQFKVGDRVAAFVGNGANTEFVTLSQSLLVPIPSDVNSNEALCLILNYVTAYQMLHRVTQVQSGDKILIHGAAGGVGTALLQLGKAAKLEMYGTASLGKHALVKELGGVPIDYKNEDFVRRISDLTGEGVDAVFDPIGGAHLRRSHEALKKGGRLILYGMSSSVSQGKGQIPLTGLLFAYYKVLPDGRKIHFYGINSSRHSNQKSIQEDLAKLMSLLAEKKIKPVIGAQLPLRDIARAHEMMDQSSVQGKIILS